MSDTASTFAALKERFARVPFNPFRGSGQGVRQDYPAQFESVQFPSEDGTPVAGKLALHRDGRPHPAIVMGHGIWFFKEVDALVDSAEFYFANGWSVLVFDFQGHGESAKLSDAPYTMGWKEADNMLGAAKFLKAREGVSSVAIFGHSLAGAATLLAAERAQGIADCLVVGSAPARQEPHFIMSHIDKWLRIAKTDPISYFEQAGAYYGKSGEEIRKLDETEDAVRTLTLPTLFVQTAEDDFIPASDASLLEAAARENENVLVVTEARGGHGLEMYLNDRYWLKAITAGFLKAFQAPNLDYVSDSPWPALDIQLKIEAGWENLLLATIWLRNSETAISNLVVTLPLLEDPAPSYLAAPAVFGEVERTGKDLVWRAGNLPGNGELVGPFTIALPIDQIPTGTRLRTRVTATWDGGTARSNEASYTKR